MLGDRKNVADDAERYQQEGETDDGNDQGFFHEEFIWFKWRGRGRLVLRGHIARCAAKPAAASDRHRGDRYR